MRLNGWMRLGVVLSAVWMVGYSGYLFNDEMAKQRATSNYFYNERSNCMAANVVRRAENKPEATCISQATVDSTYTSSFPWFVVIVPTIYLVLAWIVIGIAYGAFRWIRNGFVRS